MSDEGEDDEVSRRDYPGLYFSLCGCTEEDPCPEGCWWKEGDPEVCDAHDGDAGGAHISGEKGHG